MRVDQSDTYLETKGIRKTFPGVLALDDVDFDTCCGEVHAVVGANGAGKSTLVKILSGVYHPDRGDILLAGQKIVLNHPLDAKKKGIVTAYQEVDTSLVRYLSVAENVMVNQLVEDKKIFVNWKELYRGAQEYLDRVDLRIDLKKPVSELSLSQKQKVVIAQALEQKAKFLILDEPTAPLSMKEVDQLFLLIRNLTSSGIGIIYISHRMAEVFSIADRITVMRDGKCVATQNAKQTKPDEIVYQMLQKSVLQPKEHKIKTTRTERKIFFAAENLSRPPLVKNVSFKVREGEVLGITGLVGAGKTELARIIFGADRLKSGDIFIKGKKIKITSPACAVKKGLMLVPEERRQQGVLLNMNVTQNLTLSSLEIFSKTGFINQKKENVVSKKIVGDINIVCQNIDQKVKYLSGGNQQKVAVGKWLVTPGLLFIFDEPTKGVDIGAKEEIYRLISRLTESGASVIFFSSEIPEIIRMSDRILVMYDGRIITKFDRNNATEKEILKFATGGGNGYGTTKQ